MYKRPLIFLLLLFSIAFSDSLPMLLKDASLYADNETINYTNYGNYTVVLFNQTPSLLYFNNTLVLNSTDIQQGLGKYFNELYKPKNTELIQIKTMILQYNASRNSPSTYSQTPETTCLANFGLNMDHAYARGCKQGNRTDCENLVFYTYCAPLLADGLSDCDYQLIGGLLNEFVNASRDSNELVVEINNILDNLNVDNYEENIQRVSQKIDELYQAGETLHNSRLRCPVNFEDHCNSYSEMGDQYCLCMCSTILPNFTILNNSKQLLLEVKQKYNNLSSSIEIINNIINNTEKRTLAFLKNKEKIQYLSQFSEVESMLENETERAKKLKLVYSDMSYTTLYNRIKEYENNISNAFDTLNFTNMSEKINALKTLVPQLKQKNDQITSLLNNCSRSLNKTYSLAKLQNLVLKDSTSQTDYQQAQQLLNKFNPTTAQPIIYYSDIQEQAEQLEQRIEDRLKNIKKTSTTGSSTIKKFFIPLSYLLNKYIGLDLHDIFYMSDKLLIAISSIFILTIISLAFSKIIFISFVLLNKFYFNKKILILIYLVLLFIPLILIGLSGLFYFSSVPYVYSQSEDLTQKPMFVISEIHSSNNLIILAQSTNSTINCALEIQNQWNQTGKNVEIIYINQSDNLLSKIYENNVKASTPILILKQQDSEIGEAYTLPYTTLFVQGNADLFNLCPLKNLN